MSVVGVIFHISKLLHDDIVQQTEVGAYFESQANLLVRRQREMVAR